MRQTLKKRFKAPARGQYRATIVLRVHWSASKVVYNKYNMMWFGSHTCWSGFNLLNPNIRIGRDLITHREVRSYTGHTMSVPCTSEQTDSLSMATYLYLRPETAQRRGGGVRPSGCSPPSSDKEESDELQRITGGHAHDNGRCRRCGLRDPCI